MNTNAFVVIEIVPIIKRMRVEVISKKRLVIILVYITLGLIE